MGSQKWDSGVTGVTGVIGVPKMGLQAQGPLQEGGEMGRFPGIWGGIFWNLGGFPWDLGGVPLGFGGIP